MPKYYFTEEYDAIKQTLTSASGKIGADSAALVARIGLLLGADGLEAGQAAALDDLRAACKGAGMEAEALLAICSDAALKPKVAAALKNLRHTYLLSEIGGSGTWVVSLPKPYRKWPTDEMAGLAGQAMSDRLKMTEEYHTSSQMRDLSAAAQNAAGWAQKASIAASSIGSANDLGTVLVKRWFADEDHQSPASITEIAEKLVAGFNKIATAAGAGKLVLTDNLPARGTSQENDEAFVYSVPDRLNVVYIEKAFFATSGNTLSGMKNWARILIHELSHAKLDTDDVKLPGDADPRYSWHPRGLTPRKASFTTQLALKNADNWAFFAVDAAGQLTDGDRATALKPSAT